MRGRQRRRGKSKYIHTCTCALGDRLTSRRKGRSQPRELWFSIYSCTMTQQYSTRLLPPSVQLSPLPAVSSPPPLLPSAPTLRQGTLRGGW